MCKSECECKECKVEGFSRHLPHSQHMYTYIHVYIYATRMCMRISIFMYMYV